MPCPERRPCRIGAVSSSLGSIPEVLELEFHSQLGGSERGDRRLEIVLLLAGDAHGVLVDPRLDLQLAVLDQLNDLSRLVAVDALFDLHDELECTLWTGLGLAGLEIAQGDLP